MPHARGNLLKCREPSDSRAPAYATAVVMGAGFVFSMAMCWPGHLSYDSVVQLLEGRTGVYSGWHPPVMSWLLGLSDWLTPGAGLFMLATALVFSLSLFSLIWLVPRVSWIAPVLAALCLLTPQVALYQGIVWKDVLFANTMVAGFVAQAHLALNWQQDKRRYSLITLSFLLLVLATLTRQNGAVALAAGAGSLFFIWKRQSGNWRSALLGTAVVLAIGTLLALASTAALSARLQPDGGVSRQVKRLEFYDLIAGLADDPKLQLPVLQHRDPALLRLMRRDGVHFYSPVRSDTLVRSPVLQAGLASAPDDTLQQAWSSFILHHPANYLGARAAAFRWMLLTPDISLCLPYVVGVRGPAQVMGTLRLQIRENGRDKVADSYGSLFVHTPVFSHGTFLLLALGELLFLLLRGRTPDLAFIGMLAGSIAFAFSFLFISLACDYRYIYALDLTALITLIYIALDPTLRTEREAARS